MGDFDVVIVGGGVMGCATALRLAENGMRTALLERGSLGASASGVNAGTLSIQIKRAALVPYALKGYELWKSADRRLGVDVGFHVRGGLTLAFTDEEAGLLRSRMADRKAAGAPIDILSTAQARRLEPGLGDRLVLASHCPLDGYANASLTGLAYRAALTRAGVTLHESSPVVGIDLDGRRYLVRTPGSSHRTSRVVLATGAWLRETAGTFFGISWPVHCRVNQVTVTERTKPLVKAIIGHAAGLLTLKQSDNGTVLIGGGWQGTGSSVDGRTQVEVEQLVGNLRLARYAVPGLAHARIVRTWHGFEAHVPDFMPLVGPIPGWAGAFVIGCVRGGYTIGPYMGQLLGDHILERPLEMPLFEPGRFVQVADALGRPAGGPG